MSLWETNFPGRWYVPPIAVDFSLLKPSETKTGCPYKGQASYYNAIIDGNEHRDVVWYYDNPTSESALIKGLVSWRFCSRACANISKMCFYPDKVDTSVDGVAVAKIGMPPMSKSDKESVAQPHGGCVC